MSYQYYSIYYDLDVHNSGAYSNHLDDAVVMSILSDRLRLAARPITCYRTFHAQECTF